VAFGKNNNCNILREGHILKRQQTQRKFQFRNLKERTA